MPYLLMALGLSTSLIGSYWCVYERRFLRAIVWIYVGVILLLGGLAASTHVHRSSATFTNSAEPTLSTEIEPTN